MPDVVTHRYDPVRGACLNLCTLPDEQASRVLDRLRRDSRPGLKLDYLQQRRATEKWLCAAATAVLGGSCDAPPAYFFLGDFSYGVDRSRPAALVIRLASLPAGSMTFTLGDSMTVARETEPRVYRLEDIAQLFTAREVLAQFEVCDRERIQERFVEMQLWDRRAIGGLCLPPHP